MRTLKLILSGWQSVGLVVFIMLFFNMEVSGKGKITKNAPVFTQFIYQGEDAIYQNNPLKPGEFYNPILQGCYPDPRSHSAPGPGPGGSRRTAPPAASPAFPQRR